MKVAVLTFTKSAYRVGETVLLGVVELNERTGWSRVLKVSVTASSVLYQLFDFDFKLSVALEAHESLPPSIASPSSSRLMHADHHSSFMLSTLRTAFSLDIPSDART